MATHRLRGSVRRTAFLTVTLMVSLGVAVPMLDASDTFAGPTVEAEHHGSACTLHDHSICMQLGANLALLLALPTTAPLPSITPLAEAVSVSLISGRPRSEPSPARAPPHQRA